MLIERILNRLGKISSDVLGKVKCFRLKIPPNCIVHPTTKIINCKIQDYVKIDKQSYIIDSEIGYGAFIAEKSKIVRCRIGKFSLVGIECLIGAHPINEIVSIHPAFYSTKGQYGYTYVKENIFEEFKYADRDDNKAIIIGNDVWATGGIKIVQNVTIGDGAVVMAGAVVTKDVPPYAIVAGIPAKIIGYRFPKEEIDFLLKLRWWDRDVEWIKKHAKFFGTVEELKEIVLKEETDFWTK